MHEKSELEILREYMEKGPVPIQQVIRDCGIEYREENLGKTISSSIAWSRENFIITVNADQITSRIRFSAAHEFAHYLLHRDLIARKNGPKLHKDYLFLDQQGPSEPLSEKHEMQANKLAIQMLMPANIITRMHKEGARLPEIAETLKMPVRAMEKRLKSLKLAA